MSSHNRATLVGNLGADVQVRVTAEGTAVTNFRLATNDSFTDSKGQKQQRTEWHNIVVWGKQAEACAKYLKKGSKVLVAGRLQTREYTDKAGVKRNTTEVVAAEVSFLDGKDTRTMTPPPPPADAAEEFDVADVA
jgi:single-strand DNA-binding protein